MHTLITDGARHFAPCDGLAHMVWHAHSVGGWELVLPGLAVWILGGKVGPRHKLSALVHLHATERPHYRCFRLAGSK